MAKGLPTTSGAASSPAISSSRKPETLFASIGLRSLPMRGNHASLRVGGKRIGGFCAPTALRVSASIATTSEKASAVSEIVLQPIKEISGTMKLPGSKSLSNRILLLAALSEVSLCILFFVLCLGF